MKVLNSGIMMLSAITLKCSEHLIVEPKRSRDDVHLPTGSPSQALDTEAEQDSIAASSELLQARLPLGLVLHAPPPSMVNRLATEQTSSSSPCARMQHSDILSAISST